MWLVSQDDRRRGAKDASIHDKRTKKKKLQPPSTVSIHETVLVFSLKSELSRQLLSFPQRLVDSELVRRQRQEELMKLQEQRNIEKVGTFYHENWRNDFHCKQCVDGFKIWNSCTFFARIFPHAIYV